MDLNQLHHAHQVAMIGQSHAASHARRLAYADTIAILARRIRRSRKAGGAAVCAAPFVTGDPIPAYWNR